MATDWPVQLPFGVFDHIGTGRFLSNRDLIDRAGTAWTPSLKLWTRNPRLYEVDRADFVGGANFDLAYIDRPLPIPGNVTISAPHIHMQAIAALCLGGYLKPGKAFMDIGFGSGIMCAYAAAVLDIDSGNSSLCGVEMVKEVFQFGRNNLVKKYPHFAEKMHLINANGYKGCVEHAPFDSIYVGAAAEQIPYGLMNQLKVDGAILIPLGAEGRVQELALIHRNADYTDGRDPPDEYFRLNPSHPRKFTRDIPLLGEFTIEISENVAFIPLLEESPK